MANESTLCICGQPLQRPAAQTDVKCANCGRVYNYQLRFLWREAPGNDLPGSTDIEAGGTDRRAEDQQAALEKGFEDGSLPEEPRRQDDPELTAADEAEDAAIKVLQDDRDKRKKK